MKQNLYNVEDLCYLLVGSGAGVERTEENDSTQAAASTDGGFPLSMIFIIFSNEFSMNTNGKGKMFNVSIKDQ